MRLYLDTMVWSRIAEDQPKEVKYQRLKRILDDEDYLISTYLSEAHVGDQSRGKPNTETARASKRCRCNYMLDRAWGSYLIQDGETGIYRVCRVSLDDDLFGLDNMTPEIDLHSLNLEDPNPVVQAAYRLLKLQPFDLKAQIGTGQGGEEALAMLRQMFPNGMHEKTMYGVLKDILANDELTNIDEGMLNARLACATAIGQFDWKKVKDPKTYVDRLLTKQADGKPLQELFDMLDKAIADANPNTPVVEVFRQKYLMLGTFGIAPEKRFGSANDDAGHAYYATAANFFVTDDTRAAIKARVLYRILAVKTQVLSTEELLTYIDQSRVLIYRPNIEEWIKCGLYGGAVVWSGPDPHDGLAQEVRALPCAILYVFNRCQIPAGNDEVICLFYRRPVALVNFSAYEDVRRQLHWLTKTFGLDLYGLGKYDEVDEQQIKSDEEWRGRAWYFGQDFWMSFEQMEVVGPALVIRRITPELREAARNQHQIPPPSIIVE